MILSSWTYRYRFSSDFSSLFHRDFAPLGSPKSICGQFSQNLELEFTSLDSLGLRFVADSPSYLIVRYWHQLSCINDVWMTTNMACQMPQMDGLEATRRIREEEAQQGWRRLPVLGLTAHAISEYEFNCLSCGMDGYLGKPFDINQLLRVMSKYLPVLER